MKTVSEALQACRPLFFAAAVFGTLTNLLMLTGSIYMLQIYDRVLGSGSHQTLFLLTLLMALAFLTYGILDAVRNRIALRVALRLERILAEPLVRAGWQHFDDPVAEGAELIGQLERYRTFVGGSGLIIATDLPFTPVFIIAIAGLHPTLGLFALGSALLMISLAILTQISTAQRLKNQSSMSAKINRTLHSVGRAAASTRALGLIGYFADLWKSQRAHSIEQSISTDDLLGAMRSITKAIRYFVQSLILGLGAWLVLRGEISPGVMIAASIILGRALAPIDQAIAGWRQFISARQARGVLDRAINYFQQNAKEPNQLIQTPWGHLTFDRVTYSPVANSDPVIASLSLEIPAGATTGIIGPIGCGKSSVLKLLAGVTQPSSGCVRIDGADIAILATDSYGTHVGYLGHQPDLHEGTIAQNIARFRPNMDDQIVAAAQKVGVHDQILGLPNAYQSKIAPSKPAFSDGVLRRIALARAICGEPKLIFLDEPETGMDDAGIALLQSIIDELEMAGSTIVIATNRAFLIDDFDLLMFFLPSGDMMFGATEEVLANLASTKYRRHKDAAEGELLLSELVGDRS